MEADFLPVSIVRCGFYQTSPLWSLGPERTRQWDDFCLWLLTDGTGSVTTPEGTHPLLPGTCLLMRGGEPYTFRKTSRSLQHYYVHFHYLESGRPIRANHHDLPLRYRLVVGHRLLVDLLERVVYDFKRVGGRPERAVRWMETALLEVARHDLGIRRIDERTESIDKLCGRIASNPANDWRFATWAADMGVSIDRFGRLFRAHAGCAPRTYLSKARLDLAATLLCESDQSIATIAQLSGYKDPLFFTRHFTRHFGMSPTSYRRKLRA